MAGGRILGLDPGEKRIGVALSDELGWTAQPLETFERRTVEADVAHVRDLVNRHGVVRVVMGLPVRLSGEEGPEAQRVRELIRVLELALPVPVVAWDERLTTRVAEAVLLQADVSRKKRRAAVDRVAAAVLLQSYLDSQPSLDSAEDEVDGWPSVEGGPRPSGGP